MSIETDPPFEILEPIYGGRDIALLTELTKFLTREVP